MPERIRLPAPVTTTLVRSHWDLVGVVFNIELGKATFSFLSTDGMRVEAPYPTPAILRPNAGSVLPPESPLQPTGRVLMTALNKANLSVNSMTKRIFNQVITDGYLDGTVIGTPD